ncbi:very short patch repair endonuclease [Endozoicomonas ascidiicola]|uniref:very short patch repair endonuclease n=1 Tax=Endozoicomonas ascidiicola TaxID=1698521 RepID=UPI00082F0C75|nr:very short patch repair endonuclease [Endozoicomonas ascidiicola]
MDIVIPETRSKMMSGIKGKNTKPELLIRKALYSEGFRYRLHATELPAKPDLVLPKYKAIILINGCFWHGHNCHLFKWPSTRPEFWRKKIEANQVRDQSNLKLLHSMGWRVLIAWECSIKGKYRLPFDQVIDLIKNWLLVGNQFIEIRGKQ